MSGMHGALADVMTASETGEDRTTVTVLNDAMFVDTDQAQWTTVSTELYSLLARYTVLEAAMIAKSVTGLGVEAWSKLHANFSRKMLGIMFRVQRECMYPKAVKDVSQVKVAIMQFEEKWKKMMTSQICGECRRCWKCALM